MREMVYDDTRWVQRLQLMGCWDESEARKRAEAARRKKSETIQGIHQEESKRARFGINGTGNGAIGSEELQTPGVTIFDAAVEVKRQEEDTNGAQLKAAPTIEDGFDAIEISPQRKPAAYKSQDTAARLDIFSRVHSYRGVARQEYGKVYGALAPFYFDAIRC